MLLVLGIAMLALMAEPLIHSVQNVSHVFLFHIAYFLPLATNGRAAISVIRTASQGKERTTSLTFSEVVIRFYCPFVGLSGCHDGGGNGLTKTSLITHLRDRHCNGDAQAITRQSLSTNLAVFEEVEFKRMGIWFVLYELTKPHIPSSSEQLDHVDDLVQVQRGGFTLALLDSLFSKGLRTVKYIPPKCRLGFSRVLKEALDKVICTPDDISYWVSLLVLPLCLLKSFCPTSNLECKSAIKHQRQEESIVNVIQSWSLPGGSLQVMRETLAEIPLLSLIIKSFPLSTSCGQDGLCAQILMDCLSGAAVNISDELVSSITQVVNLFLDGKCPNRLGEFIASVSFTLLVKPGGGIRPIDVVWCWVASESEAILHSVNPFIEAYRDDGGLLMLLVDFKNAFNLVDREVMLREVCLRCPTISRCLSLHAWYLDDGTILGDTLVAGKVLDLIMEDGPGGHASVDFYFCNELVMKRVAKTIELMDAIAKINDPQCELLLLCSCSGISRLYFTMRTCLPRVFESAQRSFDMAFRSSLKRIVTASG
nr:hypothetical protein [Tanacetum cinerariifolium]